jgi:peptidoglycan/xylan/chitin deacetylase (PgdA/CDA1 family)
MKTIVFDIDDYSVLRQRWDLLDKLKEHYPKLKVSLFTIPYDIQYEGVHQFKVMREKHLETLKKHLDWVEIIPHGLTHMPREFEKADKLSTELALKGIDEVFKKDGIPYVKGFKAPYWLWNQEVVNVLDKHGWFGATDRNQPHMLHTKKNYVYNYSIDEPFWESKEDVLKLHSHMTLPSANNIEDCFVNLLKIPPDAEFKLVSEMI